MTTSDLYFSPDYHVPNNLDPKMEQAFCTALVYPGIICSNDGFHVIAKADGENYHLEYASCEKDLCSKDDFEKILGPTNSVLRINYTSVSTDKTVPEIIEHTIIVMILAFDKKKKYDLAATNILYRSVAGRFTKMLDRFPEAFIHGTSYIGDEAILF